MEPAYPLGGMPIGLLHLLSTTKKGLSEHSPAPPPPQQWRSNFSCKLITQKKDCVNTRLRLLHLAAVVRQDVLELLLSEACLLAGSPPPLQQVPLLSLQLMSHLRANVGKGADVGG